MRKLIVSMNVTLDGFMAGENGELDWSFGVWNERMSEAASETLHRADTILLGRVTYEAMAPYWPAHSHNLQRSRADIAFADMMNGHRKVVFSRTLGIARWDNTVLVRGNVAGFVNRLKSVEGKDLIVYGSGTIIAELAEAGLVDECHLWVHPVILGAGRRFPWRAPAALTLQWATGFPGGVVMLCYSGISVL